MNVETITHDLDHQPRPAVKTRDARDLVIEMLADSEAALREEKRLLVDLLADVAFENAVLRIAYQDEYFARVYREASDRSNYSRGTHD